MKKILLFSLSTLLFVTTNAQTGVSVNNTGASADASAMLDVSSTTTGFLFPRMTEAQKNAITLPATGLMIFQTDGAQPGVYLNGGTPAAPNWLNASGANSLNDLSDAYINGSSLFIGNFSTSTATGSGNVGVGFANLAALTSGVDNTVIGSGAGTNITTGNRNIIIGFSTEPTSATVSNELNIGNAIYATNLENAGASVGIGNGNNAPTSTLDVGGSFTLPVRLESSNYTLTENDYTVVGSNITISLPSPDNIIGRIYVIKAGTAGPINLVPDGTDVIDGSNVAINILTGKYIQIQALFAGNWVIIGQN